MLFGEPIPNPAKDPQSLNVAATPFTLGDVVCYVSNGGDVQTVDAYTGTAETDLTNGYGLPGAASSVGDIAMRNDGRLMGVSNPAPTNAGSGVEEEINTQYAGANYAGALLSSLADGIQTFDLGPNSATPTATATPTGMPAGVQMQAMTYVSNPSAADDAVSGYYNRPDADQHPGSPRACRGERSRPNVNQDTLPYMTEPLVSHAGGG